jgi:hypothetical protein
LHLAGQRRKFSWTGNKLLIDFFSPTARPTRLKVTGIPAWYNRERGSGEYPIGVCIDYTTTAEGERKKLIRMAQP